MRARKRTVISLLAASLAGLVGVVGTLVLLADGVTAGSPRDAVNLPVAGAWTGLGVGMDEARLAALAADAGALDHFVFGPIGQQTAGTAFSVTLTAYDDESAVVTEYSGTVVLSDTTGTLVPALADGFVAGVWTGTVTITRTGSSVVITATDGAVSDASTPFVVQPAGLDRFALNPVGDQTAGTAFNLTLTAYDAYDNVKTNYGGPAMLLDTTGTLVPATASGFTAGAWTGNATITRTGSGIVITATDGAVSTNTNPFAVDPAELDHIVLSPPASTIFAWQVRPYTVEAFDVYGNSRGDVTAVNTTFSIVESGHGGYWTDNVYHPFIHGDWTARAVHTGTQVATDDADLTVLGPVLRLDKSGEPDVVEAGALITYTLTCSNTGNLTATNVIVTETLDSNSVYSSASLTPDGGLPDAPYWVLGELAPDEIKRITVYVSAVRPLTNGTRLTNTAWLDAYWLGEGRTEPLSAILGTTVHSRPVLAFSKADAPDPVNASGTLRYTLVITNSGNENATSVTVVEDYDSNTRFEFAVPEPDGGSGNRQWTFPVLVVDEPQFVDVFVRVTDTLPVGTILNNQATMDSDQTSPMVATEATEVTSSPELTVNKWDVPDDDVEAGETLVYVINYQASGTADAEDVLITDTYDSRVTFLWADRDPIISTDEVWVWDIGDLDVGDSGNIYVEVRVDKPLSNGTVLTNRVTIDSVHTSPQSYVETTRVSSAPVLDLTVTDQPDPVVPGAPLNYTVRYTNTGNADATHVVITATLDANTTFVDASVPPAGGAGDVWYWEIDKIASSDFQGGHGYGVLVIETEVTLPLTNGTPLDLVVQLSDAQGDLLEATSRTTVSSAPLLSLLKSNGVTAVEAGDLLTYTLTCDNAGTENAYSVIITDTLPDHVSYVACETPVGDCQPKPPAQPDAVVFSIPTIAAPSSVEARLTVRVDDPLLAGAESLVNTARMAHPSLPGPVDVQDVDPITTRPDLRVVADHAPSIFSPGKRMVYTVTYSNEGRMDAQGVTISTILPDDTLYVGHSWDSSGGQAYTYQVGEVLAGSPTHTIKLEVEYPEDDPQEIGSSEFNTPFTIAGSGGVGDDANPGDNTAYVYIGVPDLVIADFTVQPYPLRADVPVTFTVKITNQGTGWAWNPDNGAGSSVDVYISEVESYPFVGYSEKDIWQGMPPLSPGATHTLIITATRSPTGMIEGPIRFTKQEIQDEIGAGDLYAKVDSYGVYPYGLVPEDDEYNNVGVLPRPGTFRWRAYLPFTLR